MIKRNEIIDIAKGLGIILVVIGHLPSVFGYPIYLFHMGLFFFLSGWCFNKSYLNKPFMFIMKKIKSLLVPFFFMKMAALLLMAIDVDYWNYTINQFHLLGTIWFLHALFESCVITFLFVLFFNRLSWKLWFLPIIFLLISFFFSLLGIEFVATMFYRTLFFSLGFVIKEYCPIFIERMRTTLHSICLGMGGVISLAILPRFMPTGISECNYNNYISYMLLSFIGIYLILQICHLFKNLESVSKFLIIIGQNTMPILLFQWCAFWLFDIFVKSHPTIVYDQTIFWFAKFLFGIAFPLFIQVIYKYIKKKVFFYNIV